MGGSAFVKLIGRVRRAGHQIATVRCNGQTFKNHCRRWFRKGMWRWRAIVKRGSCRLCWLSATRTCLVKEVSGRRGRLHSEVEEARERDGRRSKRKKLRVGGGPRLRHEGNRRHTAAARAAVGVSGLGEARALTVRRSWNKKEREGRGPRRVGVLLRLLVGVGGIRLGWRGTRIGEAANPGPYTEGGASSSGAGVGGRTWTEVGHGRWIRDGKGSGVRRR